MKSNSGSSPWHHLLVFSISFLYFYPLFKQNSPDDTWYHMHTLCDDIHNINYTLEPYTHFIRHICKPDLKLNPNSNLNLTPTTKLTFKVVRTSQKSPLREWKANFGPQFVACTSTHKHRPEVKSTEDIYIFKNAFLNAYRSAEKLWVFLNWCINAVVRCRSPIR